MNSIIKVEFLCWPQGTLPFETELTDPVPLLAFHNSGCSLIQMMLHDIQNCVALLSVQHCLPHVFLTFWLLDNPFKVLAVEIVDGTVLVRLLDFFCKVFKYHRLI